MPRRAPILEPLEARRLLSTVFSSVGTQPVGHLTGKIVYTNPGHGLTANSSGLWSTQRPFINSIVEDFGNTDQVNLYAEYLWRAGATVVPFRPLGHQPNEVVVDNIDAIFSGSWSNSTSTPYFSTSNGAGVGSRFASASAGETAVARFIPNLPQTGFYPVYAWALNSSNRVTDQVYRVVHSGGATEVQINHQWVGKGWVYLGTYHFRSGESGRVEVSNRSNQTGVVIADAIRFGNGAGDVAVNNRTSGELREDEANIYWMEASAGWTAPGVRIPASTWRGGNTDDGDATVGAPMRWGAYMNAAPFGQSVYLGWHTNAGGGRGTVGLWNDNTTTDTANQRAWALLVAQEIQSDMLALGSPPLEAAWNNRGTNLLFNASFSYGEIRGDVNNNEFDATIIEVAFHDSATDALLLRDPLGRDKVAQSAAQATSRYFDQFGGAPTPTFAPDAPTNVRTSVDRNGNVTIRWDAASASASFGGTPTGFRVYGSRDGYGFDGGALVNGGSARSLTIPASQVGAGVAYFKVVAVNGGGESPGSAVVAFRRGETRVGRILIVDGFDRLDRFQNTRQSIDITSTFAGAGGTPVVNERVRPRFSNSFDYAAQHASAIASHPAGFGIDTTDNLAVINGQVALSDYAAVIWFSGEESSADQTFNANERTAVTSYINAGGRFMVSGAEIGFEMVSQNVAPTFFTGTLRAGYVGDDAGTYNVAGAAGSIFSGVSLTFDNGSQFYDAEFPDRLSATGGSTVVMNYSGGTGGGAATAWSGTNGARTLVMGFPFETITSAAVRNDVMNRALTFFQIDDGRRRLGTRLQGDVLTSNIAQPATRSRSAMQLVDAEPGSIV
jgi:hypothetical protein